MRFLAFAALILVGCGRAADPKISPPPASVIAIERGTTNHAKVGDTLEIAYTNNGSIGYRYSDPVVTDPSVLASIGPQPEPAASEPIPEGSGSTARWRFRALKTGSASVTMKYEHRSGIPDQPPIRFEVEVGP